MKIKKQKIFLISLIVLLAGFFALFDFDKNQPVSSPEKVNISPVLDDTIEQTKEKVLIPENKIKVENFDKNQNTNVSLEVNGKNYNFKVKEKSSVFEAMKTLENSFPNDFNFRYKEHEGLGSFVTEINGLKGSSGKYWIYYINNEKPAVGVSQLILKEGDIIRWNQEGL